MSDPSKSIAAKAEARRRKILENAQRRLNKVQELKGVISQSSSDSCQENDDKMKVNPNTELPSEKETELHYSISATHNANLPSSIESESNTTAKSSENNDVLHNEMTQILNKILLSNKKAERNPVAQVVPRKCTAASNVLENGDSSRKRNSSTSNVDPIPDEFDFSNHLKFLESQSQSKPSQQSKESHCNFSTLLYYVVLAIVVRLMLYMQCGWIFGDMILVPFLLTEGVQIFLGNVHKSQLVQVLSQVMALGGFPNHIVQCYARISTLLLHCIEDYSVYFVTFCVLHSYLDEDVFSR